MQKVNENHVFTGMQRDLSVSKHPAQYLYDARNIRLTAREGDTLFTITNERGTKDLQITVAGHYLGHCLLNQYLIVFSKNSDASENQDFITKIDLKETQSDVLYNGNLNFSLDHPIEAISSYENADIQKVYWTDGYNQPRVVNIVDNKDRFNDSYFDFVRDLALNEKVRIQKQLGSGRFAPGVIQYAFTYYTKHGQESNIFYTSPLMYISYKDRGASPEDMVENSFKITVENLDNNFDYLRIYSIQRTSLDGTPIVKRIQDIDIKVDGSAIVTDVPFVTSSTAPELPTGGIIEHKYFLYSSVDWYGYRKGDFPNLVIATSSGYVTWGSESTDESYIWVSKDKITNMETKVTGFQICETYTRYSPNLISIGWSQKRLLASSVSFTDTGNTGDSIDPTELLYKGGESLIAQTIEQKDNTLFLGNIQLQRPQIGSNIKKKIQDKISGVKVADSTRTFYPLQVNNGVGLLAYDYDNQLVSVDSQFNSVPCGGFKWGDYYRCGVQFQYKDGKWSDPIFIDDVQVSNKPEYIKTETSSEIALPALEATISSSISNTISSLGYKKARAVVVYPGIEDRIVICQGVVCPTLKNGGSNKTHYKSSWFFRPIVDGVVAHPFGTTSPFAGNNSILPEAYHVGMTQLGYEGVTLFNPVSNDIRLVEIQGVYSEENSFTVKRNFLTFHSPDVEFDDKLQTLSYIGTVHRQVGFANFKSTFSDIDIQTASPTIDSSSSGFLHKSCISEKSYGFTSGLFYEDSPVTYDKSEYKKGASTKWLVFPWHGSGSLNNDVNRPANKGTRTSELKKKVISNLRFSDTSLFNNPTSVDELTSSSYSPQLFDNDEVNILKFGQNIYQGNVDTLLPMDAPIGFFANLSNSVNLWTCYYDKKYYTWQSSSEEWKETSTLSDEISTPKSSVRMKYKSTPHLVIAPKSFEEFSFTNTGESSLPIIEICRQKPANLFGGTSEDALKANTWIPCGEPVNLGESYDGKDSKGATVIQYSWGDTYFQRWDCLKTYPFTPEDINQIVEIGSFMLETRVNIDGRYDRNRGQLNNLNMTPQNFNLLNPVYSQVNNFFSYRILDDNYYSINRFPNQITWTKEKQSGADTDLWTNLTLASTYDMDGSKGEVVSLNTWKDQIFCFQNKGISNILFNSRVQIPTSDNVPIEITNSYKVDGYRYLADGIGCNSRQQIKETPSGIYFIDSVSNYLFRLGEGLQDISTACNMTSWFKDSSNKIDRLTYDEVNHDIYLVSKKEALCFSEVLNQFTSFMDYGDMLLTESYNHNVFALHETTGYDCYLYQMFAGDEYNDFFGRYLIQDGTMFVYTPIYKPWSLTFISNGIGDGAVNLDKTFTNIEFRASVEDDGEYDENTGRFTFALPFDSIEVWNEYQHGITSLKNQTGHAGMRHPNEGDSSLKRKYRIWRCDIPRDNAPIGSDKGLPRLYRKIVRPVDRMRNPWLYIRLQNKAEQNNAKTEIHDIMTAYYV